MCQLCAALQLIAIEAPACFPLDGLGAFPELPVDPETAATRKPLSTPRLVQALAPPSLPPRTVLRHIPRDCWTVFIQPQIESHFLKGLVQIATVPDELIQPGYQFTGCQLFLIHFEDPAELNHHEMGQRLPENTANKTGVTSHAALYAGGNPQERATGREFRSKFRGKEEGKDVSDSNAPAPEQSSDLGSTQMAAFQRLQSLGTEKWQKIVNDLIRGLPAQPLARLIQQEWGDALDIDEDTLAKQLTRLAVEWEIIPISSAQTVKSPRVPAGRVRYLQPAELQTLLSACPDWLRPIVGLAVVTGMRRSEILKLRWLDVDFAQAHIMLPQTKNGEGRVVQLNQSALAALHSIARSPEAKATGSIFGSIAPERVSVAFARLCRSQKIENFRFHDLRHTTASWLRMEGADIHTVAQLLGHKDLRMAARYQHLSPVFLAKAVASLDGLFGIPRYPCVTETKQITGEVAATA